MSDFDISLDNAVFTYVLHSKKHENLSNCIFIENNNLYLSYSKKTEVMSYESGENAVYIIGLCVDSHGELARYDIPKFLLSLKDINIDSITKVSSRFAGNYMILVSLEGFLYAFNDAINAVPIYYSTKGVCLSSFENVAAKVLNAVVDKKYYNIRLESDYDAAMPNDITIYKNIKLVLPNHYLDVNTSKVKRFYPIEPLTYFKEPNVILERQIPRLQNIIQEYIKYTGNDIVHPLTSGWDSRTVLSFLLKNVPDIMCYTFVHKNFTQTTADVVIPRKISNLTQCKYIEIPDLMPEDSFYTDIAEIIGSYYYFNDLSMAYTYKKHFGNSIMINNSSIIDLLDKNHKVVFLPIWCASAKFFKTKLRNISKYTEKEIVLYLQEITAYNLSQYVYDLFGWEILEGRAFDYNRTIYRAAGIVWLNFFNCREILNEWIQIRRSTRRKKHIIHTCFLSNLAPDLLKIPFNPDTKFSYLRKSRFLYFFVNYFRYFLRKWKKTHLKKNGFKIKKYQICTRCVMDNTSDETITFDENGYCNYCTEALNRKDKVYFPNEEGKKRLDTMLSEIKKNSKNKQYDCLMGISGGLDSSYLLYLGSQWGLRILAVHIDDGFDTEISKSNIKKLCNTCGVDLIIERPDSVQFNDLTASYIRANVPNIAIPQDNILLAYLYKYSRKYKIKYFLSGGNFALECILQKGNMFTMLDVVNIKAIHKRFGQKKIDNLPFLSNYRKFFDIMMLGIKTYRPLNYIEYNRKVALNELYDFCEFEYYGSKHLENILTKFIQQYWFYERYCLDKRRAHLSSMIVSDQMTREEALSELQKPIYDENDMKATIKFILSKLNISEDEFIKILLDKPKQHYNYTVDHFTKLINKIRL